MFKKKEEIKIKVDGMSCQKCATRVTNVLKTVEGVKKVAVDLDEKQVTIKGSNIEEKELQKKIEDLGYTYQGIVK